MNVTKKSPPQMWQSINWRAVESEVTNLRQRIYVASRNNDLKRVRNLQKQMLRSQANMLLAVRRVTQINRGRRTAGVDNKVVTTTQDRWYLFRWVIKLDLRDYNPLPVRRVEIPKNGSRKKRPLGIPTIRDRVIQAMVKNALEPFWEARFEASSYGFRPGRSTHDAIEDIWTALVWGKRPWVLDADIKGAFD